MVAAALGAGNVAGTCFYGAVMLQRSVAQFTGFTSEVRGGGDGDGGYMDCSGRMHGHYWVVAWRTDDSAPIARRETWVLDITSDQFGGPAVALLPIEFAEVRYVAGDQRLVDDQVAAFGSDLRRHGLSERALIGPRPTSDCQVQASLTHVGDLASTIQLSP